jgi:hypothetical protein
LEKAMALHLIILEMLLRDPGAEGGESRFGKRM